MKINIFLPSLPVIVNYQRRLITVVVDVEQLQPVVCLVDAVSLSVELAGQGVEQLLRLPAQEGEPVLKHCHSPHLLTINYQTADLVSHCAGDLVFLLQAYHLIHLSCFLVREIE